MSPLTDCVTPTPPALVKARVSLQALMPLLGHVGGEPSLWVLSDATVRTEYERALGIAKQNNRHLTRSGRPRVAPCSR